MLDFSYFQVTLLILHELKPNFQDLFEIKVFMKNLNYVKNHLFLNLALC